MKILFLSLTLLISSVAFANAGHDQGGGGDLCQKKIINISKDLRDWITQGGPQGLNLSNVSVATYSSVMLNQIDTVGEKNIHCVSQGDPGFPVMVGKSPKVCRFDRIGADRTITCDFSKFTGMDPSDQYVLVHHEYAGLAGLELPDGEISTYPISQQISEFLTLQTDYKLAVKKPGVRCTPYAPLKQLAKPIQGEVELFTPKGFAEATKNYPHAGHYDADHNTFSFTEQDFCIRDDLQNCEGGGVIEAAPDRSISLGGSLGGQGMFVYLGSFIPPRDPGGKLWAYELDSDGHIQAGYGATREFPGLYGPTCSDQDGTGPSFPATPGAVYAIRILSSSGARQDQRDMIGIIKIVSVDDLGIGIQYLVLGYR